MKISFDINKLEIGDTIEFFNGEKAEIEDISKCPCGNCEVYYLNNRYSTEYNYIKYIIKNKVK